MTTTAQTRLAVVLGALAVCAGSLVGLGAHRVLADTLQCIAPHSHCLVVSCESESGICTSAGGVSPYNRIKQDYYPLNWCDDGGTGCTVMSLPACRTRYYSSNVTEPCPEPPVCILIRDEDGCTP